MKKHVQVAVIGGGVVGCSVLYHLTKLDLTDAVLIERSELTSGSTWHAAGGMHTMNNDPVVSKLQKYTIDLYKEIEELSEVNCGVHRSGGFMLAEDEARLDVLKNLRGMGKYMGIELEFADLSEVAERCPIIDTSHFIAALWDPNEGHVDPWGVTNAYAKSARIGGAEIYRNTKVEALAPRADGGWDVTTDQGVIHAEKVVNAAGLWAREVGRMAGIELPVLAMEHHYLITEDIPALQQASEEMPHCIDFSGEIYIRQEGKGVLLGTYEKECVPWSPHTTPWDF
ncbi:MAG: FAD-binding oxidoreductase, partial [Gammaproteobacteria bacterium]|nr:FAD-binding oxidoreductase [Gammaproteobacteria bacterium]